MFSGIVESVMPILSSQELKNAYRINIQKPSEFNDIKNGDSIACDGVCLTVESFDEQQMSFALGAETIRVLRWNPESWKGRLVNLERSLRFGDRIHGHFVSGHVDSLGEVLRAEREGESFFLDVQVTESVLPLIWPKGSITLNGVSLTINSIQDFVLSVCLIPETQKRTNLGSLKKNDFVNVEPDFFARAVQRAIELRKNEYVLRYNT